MQTLLKQIDDALEKLQSLELELAASGIEHVELYEKVKNQERQLQQLNDEKQELSKDLQSCQERLSILEAQLSKWDVTADILAENLVLIKENEELKTENETLLTNVNAHDENKVLSDENTNLKKENGRLQEEIANLHKKQLEVNGNESLHQPKESIPTKKAGKSKKRVIDKDSTDIANQLYFDFMDIS